MPGRTAYRTAGTSLGSAGPRPNIKDNTPDSGIEPVGSSFFQTEFMYVIKSKIILNTSFMFKFHIFILLTHTHNFFHYRSI